MESVGDEKVHTGQSGREVLRKLEVFQITPKLTPCLQVGPIFQIHTPQTLLHTHV